MSTFAIPNENGVTKTSSLAKEVHWKDWLLYKKQVPRKYNLSRSVNFFGN